MKNTKLRFLTWIAFLPMFISLFYFDNINNLFLGLKEIMLTPTILDFDVFSHTQSLSAIFLNVGLCSLLVVFIYYIFNIKLGPTHIVAFFQTFGFSFYGKNIINIIPSYLSIFLLAYLKKEKVENYLPFGIFSTAIAPLFSSIVFGNLIPTSLKFRLPIALFLNFCIIYLALSLKDYNFILNKNNFHYESGYYLGLSTIIFYQILKGFGFNQDYDIYPVYNNQFSSYNSYFLALFIIFLFCLSLYYQSENINNMALTSTLAFLMLKITRANINGPVIGAFFTLCGLSYGLITARTYLKAVFTYFLLIFLYNQLKVLPVIPYNQRIISLMALFIGGYAPLFERQTLDAYILTLALHILLTPRISVFHGKIMLYNNGLAAGLVSGVCLPIYLRLKDKIKTFIK